MEKEIPKISVIMSIYNQKNKEYLEKSIQSVLKQTFRDFEFILYSDGSDAEIVEELKKYAASDERIVFINNPVNTGLASSLNNCIAVAGGEYLARMDDDDICAPERFALQYDFLEKHPDVMVVGSAIELFDAGGTWGIRQYPEYPEEKDFLKFSPYAHPSVMIRREVFSKTHSYQAGEGTWRCEDYELFMRMYQLGMRGCNLPQPLLKYREDRASYRKRKWKYRIDEMKLRYRNFKKMGLLLPFGWLAVLRPIASGLVPGNGILKMRKIYFWLHHLKKKKDV